MPSAVRRPTRSLATIRQCGSAPARYGSTPMLSESPTSVAVPTRQTPASLPVVHDDRDDPTAAATDECDEEERWTAWGGRSERGANPVGWTRSTVSSTARGCRSLPGGPTPRILRTSRAGSRGPAARSTPSTCRCSRHTPQSSAGEGAASSPVHDRAAPRGRAIVSPLHVGAARVPAIALPPRRRRRLPGRTKARGRRGAARGGRRRQPARDPERARSWSSRTRVGCAARRPSGSASQTSTSSRRRVHVLGKGAQGAGRAARGSGGAAVALYLRDARPRLARGATDTLFLSHPRLPLDTSALRRLMPQPAPAAARLRDAPARGRRRPAHHPGAARPRVAVDDPGLQPRRRAQRLRRVYDHSASRS